MKKYAILIGNSRFPDETDKSKLPDLTCPEQDVDGLSTVLASERGEFDVLSLKNQPSYQILRELQRKVKQANSDDLLLLYYSGHGKPDKSGFLHLTTLDTVIAELETSAIPINRVYDILGTGRAKKIVIILDCCYSGAAGQGFKGAMDDQLQQLNNARGTYLVTASTELQVAHESAEEGLSLFTKHLIAGLETGEADKDGDGWVSMNELYDYVQGRVVAENPAQQPTKHVKEERGGVLIAKSGRDSKKERFKKIKNCFYELSKEEKITHDILIKVLELLKISESDFSPFEQQQYVLVVELFENKMLAVEFVRKWDRLAFEIEKAREKVIEGKLKAEKEKAAQEKIAQETRERERLEKERLAQQKKAEEEKAARVKAVIKEKAAQETRERERLTSEELKWGKSIEKYKPSSKYLLIVVVVIAIGYYGLSPYQDDKAQQILEAKQAVELAAQREAEQQRLAREAEAKRQAEAEKQAEELAVQRKAEQQRLAREIEAKRQAEAEKQAAKLVAQREVEQQAENKKTGITSDIVTDARTGLMWTSKDNGKKISWDKANQYCKNLKLGNYTDWQLPTATQLESIYDPNNKTGVAKSTDPTDIYTISGFHLTDYCVWGAKNSTGSAAAINYISRGVSYDGKAYWYKPDNINKMTNNVLCVRHDN